MSDALQFLWGMIGDILAFHLPFGNLTVGALIIGTAFLSVLIKVIGTLFVSFGTDIVSTDTRSRREKRGDD